MRRLIIKDTNDKFEKIGGALSYKYHNGTLTVKNIDRQIKCTQFKEGDYIYIDFSQARPVGIVMSPNDICKFTMWAMGVPSNRRHTKLSSYIEERLSVPKILPMIKPKEEVDYAASMAVKDGGRITILSMVIRKEYIDSLSEDDRNNAIADVMINYPKGYNLVPFEHLRDKLKTSFNFSDDLLCKIEEAWDSYDA